MAKDPAMLWYWSDWYSGTATMTRHFKGCYMDVLHAQFNDGHLTLEEIRTVLGSDFGQAWPAIQKKFAVDEAGKYFNVRLETEKNKRAAFTASRRKNLESAHMEPHMNSHMAPHMENVNRNRSLDVFQGKGMQGEREFSDVWFDELFNQRRIEDYKMTFPHKNIDNELAIFRMKVKTNRDYQTRDDGGLQNAFIFQLNKQNGHSKAPTEARRTVTLDELNQP